MGGLLLEGYGSYSPLNYPHFDSPLEAVALKLFWRVKTRSISPAFCVSGLIGNKPAEVHLPRAKNQLSSHEYVGLLFGSLLWRNDPSCSVDFGSLAQKSHELSASTSEFLDVP